MGYGDSGGGGGSVSMPLTGEQRSAIFNSAMKDLGGYMPRVESYQGFGVIDPSADRGRGAIYNGRTGYAGYQNIAPRTINSNVADYGRVQQTANENAVNSTTDAVQKYLDDYFAKREETSKEDMYRYITDRNQNISG